ncbi:hypothetical protein GCM10010191_55850 [Actinomadura vinacea]|uniref:Mce-associated membrane protein n=1 Tax=Actinomadura vinacea TaxID=115336 RepID=A0ABP5WRF3_9ACTN
MTGKTTKDVPEDAEDVDAVDEEAEEAEAKPAPRRRRRVRVIEVLDDEDLDEVLDAIDAEDEDTEPRRPPAKAKTPAKRVVEEAEELPKPKPAPARKAPVSLDEAAPRTFLGLRPNQAVVVVLVVAVLASLAIWQWRTASGLSGDADERAAVSKVASDYGDVALNYNASNYQSQMKRAEGLMGGDLLESFKANTLPNLGNTFKENPQLVLTSKTDQVFVGSVDQRFASATISVNVGVRTTQGAQDSPATLIRLAMAKIDGKWKVTKMYASGANDQTQQSGGLPNVPTTPAPSKSATPKNEKKPKD